MQTSWEEGDGGPGVSKGFIDFEIPKLAPYRWPVIQARGRTPGAKLCVMAGVHVNESSSIQAALSLLDRIAVDRMSGTLSILPLVNQPAEYERVKEIPVDKKNIHELYPGSPHGTFSEVLADALLFRWAADADAVIDLHGGDFGQNLLHPFVVVQRIGDVGLDARNESLAACFQPPFLVSLEPEIAARPGRICSALARVGRSGLVVEAGACGMVDETYVDFHLRGIVNVARRLGMIDEPVDRASIPAVVLDRYLFVNAPVNGFVQSRVEAGQRVTKGQVVAGMVDAFRRPLAEAVAPEDGYVTWRTTQILAKAGSRIVAMGRSRV